MKKEGTDNVVLATSAPSDPGNNLRSVPEIVWPRGADGLYRRTLLEVALNGGNFKLELSALKNDTLNAPDYIQRAIHRSKQWLERVIFPEIILKQEWRSEDCAGDRPENPDAQTSGGVANPK